MEIELQESANLPNIGTESNTDITDYAIMEDDKVQLHQLYPANWEEELLSMLATEYASLTSATQEDQNSDEEQEHNNHPSSTEDIQSHHTTWYSS